MPEWLAISITALAGGLLCLMGLRFGLGRLFGGAWGLSGMRPLRLTTQALGEPAIWKNGKAVWRSRRYFESQGFHWVTDMQIKEVEGLVCCCLLNDQGAAVVLNDHSRMGFWVDLCLAHGERGGLTVTSQSDSVEIKIPPFSQKFILEDASPEELWLLFQEKCLAIDSDSIRPMTAESLLKDFERSYADQVDWRNSRGVTRREVRRRLESLGQKPSNEELDETWRRESEVAAQELSDGLLFRFAEQLEENGGASFEANESVAIHDGLGADGLLRELCRFMDDDEYEATELPPACLNEQARAAFAVVQEMLPEEARFSHVGHLSFPLDTDFYLPPEKPIPVELFPHQRIDPEGC